MKTISPNIQLLLEQSLVSVFYLVELGAGKNAPARYHCSLLRNIIVSGTTYLGANSTEEVYITPPGVVKSMSQLLSIEYPKASSIVDRQAYIIKYVDPEFLFRPSLEDGYNNAPIVVKIGFFNTTEGPIWSGMAVNPGEPLLDPEDIIIAYKGRVDSQTYDIQPDESVILTIECTSPMGALGAINAAYTSKDWLEQEDPNAGEANRDCSFDQVYEGSKGFNLLWGKI